MKVVLASTSKFKSKIFDTVGIKHSMVESDFNENLINEENVYEYVKKLALGKANSIKDKVDNSIIIGLDTIVYANEIVLEKPKNIDEVRKSIDLCKNNTTSVITGICIINQNTNEVISEYCESKVTLRDISEDDINYYIENEPNIMYSSGFVIETIMSNFIEKIEGSFYNILGIPVETIYKYVNNMGYNLRDLESEDTSKTYNKLVRDNIPNIIKSNGENPIISILEDEKYKEELEKKLYEEYMEVIESSGMNRIEELADMLEVMKALAKLENKTLEDVIEVAKEKTKKRGAFDKKIFLEKVN